MRLFSSIPSRSFPSLAPRSVPGGTGSAARSSPALCPRSVLLIPLRDPAVPSPWSVLPLPGTPRSLLPVPAPCCPLFSGIRQSTFPRPRCSLLSRSPVLVVPSRSVLSAPPGTPRSRGAPAALGAVSPELPPVLPPRSTLRSSGSSSPWPCSGTARCPWSYCGEDDFTQKSEKRELASPSEADALLFQPVLCFLSVIGSSSIIAYAVFQNAVRSPEVRSEFLSPSLSCGVSLCRWITPVAQTLS